MNGPVDEDTAPQEALASRSRDLDEWHRDSKLERNRRYREFHPEPLAETRRRWVEANRDRVR